MKKVFQIALISSAAASYASAYEVYSSEDGGTNFNIGGKLHVNAGYGQGANDTVTGNPKNNFVAKDNASRFNFSGETKIGSSAAMGIVAEWGYNTDANGQDGGSFAKNRLANIYLDTGGGVITVGRQWTVLYDAVASMTDRFEYGGGDGLDAYSNDDGSMYGTGRGDAISYKFSTKGYNDFDAGGVMFGVQYQTNQAFDEATRDYSVGLGLAANIRNYKIGATVSTGNYRVGHAYTAGDQAAIDNGEEVTRRPVMWSVGLSAEYNKFIIAATYGAGSQLASESSIVTSDSYLIDSKLGSEVFLKYMPTDSVWIYGGWNYLREDFVATSAKDLQHADRHYVELGVGVSIIGVQDEKAYIYIAGQYDIEGNVTALTGSGDTVTYDSSKDALMLGLVYKL